ncbi:MAG: hypothetical protein AAF629_19815 [Chloroflexota bacterium]
MTSEPIYIYHIVPHNLTGSTLYPLNQLAELYPDIYAHHVKKYDGREDLTKQRIPVFNCLWNDVLQCSPVPPDQLQQAFREAGFHKFPKRWFRLDPQALGFNSHNTVIFHPKHRELGDFSIQPQQISPFSRQAVKELIHIPPAMMTHLHQSDPQGRRPLLFRYIPHIFHLGIIDIKAVPIITLSEED